MRVPSKNIHEFLGQGVLARVLADRHFPHDCSERDLLLGIENTFRILWNVHFSLQRTLRQIERVRHLTLPNDREVIEIALALKNTAARCEPGSESQEINQRAGELLHIWFDLYLILGDVLKESEPLRFVVGSQEGES